MELLQCNNSNSNLGTAKDGATAPPVNVGSLLLQPPLLPAAAPDMAFRQQLTARPSVLVRGQEAPLTRPMLDEVFALADDLHITEQKALVLFAEAMQMPPSSCRAALEEQLTEPLIPPSSSLSPNTGGAGAASSNNTSLEHDVPRVARELYFHEQRLYLRTILMLLKARLQNRQGNASAYVIQGTDGLLQAGLVSNLIKVVRDYTSQHIDPLTAHLLAQSQTPPQDTTTAFSSSSMAPFDRKLIFDRVRWKFSLQERQTAAECLFFIAYHVQLPQEEVASLIDLIKDLTNGLPTAATTTAVASGTSAGGLTLLDPFHDVPNPYEDPPITQDQQAAAWMRHYDNNNIPLAPSMLREKDPFTWQEELIVTSMGTGQPQLLRCVSALIMATLCALDGRNALLDRNTHQLNSFGTVRTCLFLF